MSGDQGTPSAIHAGMGTITPEAHAANVIGARRFIARRTEDCTDVLAMLGLDEPQTAPVVGVGHSYRHYRQAAAVIGVPVGRMV